MPWATPRMTGAVVGPPVELGLFEAEMLGLAQTKENFHQRAGFPRHHFFRRRVDLRVFVVEPQRRMGQIDEARLILDEFFCRGLTGRVLQG